MCGGLDEHSDENMGKFLNNWGTVILEKDSGTFSQFVKQVKLKEYGVTCRTSAIATSCEILRLNSYLSCPFTSLRFCDLGTRFGELEKDVVSKRFGLKKISDTRKLKLNRSLNQKAFPKGSFNYKLFPVLC